MSDATPDPEPADFTRPPNRLDADTLESAHGRLPAVIRTRTGLADYVADDLVAVRAGEPAEVYLARHVRRAAAASAATALGFAAATPLAATALGVAGLLAPLAFLGAVVGALLGLTVVFGGALAYPRVRAEYRERRVDAALPHALLYLYALSQSGVDLTDAINRVAEREAEFGPVASEFQRLRNDLAWFSRDLVYAVEQCRDETPSEDLTVFLDELLTVVQTGGRVPDFLADEIESQFETARERQERLVDDVATYGELYVALVFAGPLFLFVVLVVIGLVTPSVVWAMYALVYAGIPLAVLLFLVTFRFRLGPHVQRPGTGIHPQYRDPPPAPDGSSRIETYRSRVRTSRLQYFRDHPRQTLTTQPLATLAATVPLAALIALGLALTGTVPTATPLSDPLQLAAYVVLPALVVAVPFSVVHEHGRANGLRLRRRFPPALDVIADGLENGVPVPDVFTLVSRRTTGTLSRELGRVDRDLEWGATLHEALGRFDGRVGDPTVSQAIATLSDVLDATHDVADVLRNVATHVENRVHLLEDRHTNVRPYVYAVSIGVLVFLAIVALFDTFFLTTLHEAARRAAEAEAAPLAVGRVPIETYRRLLYHAAVLQAAGNGLLLGVLLEDRLATGVKYTAAYLVLTGITLTALGVL